MKKFLPIIFYLVLLIILEIIFWTNRYNCGLGFGIITYYLLFPISILIISIIYSKKIKSNKKYYLIFLFGLSIMLFEYSTYSLGNMLTFKKINMPNIYQFLIYGGISFLGLLLGNLKSKR